MRDLIPVSVCRAARPRLQNSPLSGPSLVGHSSTAIAGSSGAPVSVTLRVPWAKRSCAKRAE
jgi:hypothetical protein